MTKYLLILLLAGCTTVPVTPPNPIQTPTKGWSYDALVASLVTPKMLAADPWDLCPGGKATVAFWQALAAATAKAESGFDPNQDYTEKFPDSAGKRQVSSGLFQISLDDKAKGTPNCLKLSPANIHDPVINTSCAMEMMDWLTGSRSTLRASLGRYWSTIRDGKVGSVCK